MRLNDLTREQIISLKESLLVERTPNVPYGELCDADDLVTDDEIIDLYEDTIFSEEDFPCV